MNLPELFPQEFFLLPAKPVTLNMLSAFECQHLQCSVHLLLQHAWVCIRRGTTTNTTSSYTVTFWWKGPKKNIKFDDCRLLPTCWWPTHSQHQGYFVETCSPDVLNLFLQLLLSNNDTVIHVFAITVLGLQPRKTSPGILIFSCFRV